MHLYILQPPLSSTNFLFEMDKITQNIIDEILTSRRLGLVGVTKVSSIDVPVNIPADMSASQMNRCRRQFLNYMKLHSNVGSTMDKIPSMFVQFLNKQYQ